MDTTTVAKLRPLLANYFDPPRLDTALRVAREVGVISEGQSGFGGCRSAPVDIRQVALVLLALPSGANPKDGPAEAERIGAFRLLRRDNTHLGREPHEPRSQPYQGERIITLGDFMAAEIGRGTDPDHLSLGWCIGDEHEAWRLDPDHLVFGDGTPGGLGDCVERLTKLPMSLFADIAGLFIEDAGRGSLARDEKAA
jgi:hypothetical protein